MSSGVSRGGADYTPLFCEENIWRLARRMLDAGAEPRALHVLILSNPDKSLLMQQQCRAGPQGYVVWDYHVVLRLDEQIFDFDTTLSFPVPASDYFAASFPDQRHLKPAFRGWVRSVPAVAFIQNFFSDRCHMLGLVAEAEFPPWPAIQPQHAQVVALSDYIDMYKPLADGSEVMTVRDYCRRQVGAMGRGDVDTDRTD